MVTREELEELPPEHLEIQAAACIEERFGSEKAWKFRAASPSPQRCIATILRYES